MPDELVCCEIGVAGQGLVEAGVASCLEEKGVVDEVLEVGGQEVLVAWARQVVSEASLALRLRWTPQLDSGVEAYDRAGRLREPMCSELEGIIEQGGVEELAAAADRWADVFVGVGLGPIEAMAQVSQGLQTLLLDSDVDEVGSDEAVSIAFASEQSSERDI